LLSSVAARPLVAVTTQGAHTPAVPQTTSIGVAVWTTFLDVIAAFNLCAWVLVAARLVRSRPKLHPSLYAVRRRQLVFSALFVLGCAFRSVFPRADVQRICFHDSWLSSVAVGRSVASVAEVAFIAQWALLLREAARSTGSRLVAHISRMLVPLIVVAELFSWYAVLSTNYLGNVLEESTWTVASILVLMGFGALWVRLRGRLRGFLGTSLFLLGAYFVFMCAVEVPMYVSRRRVDIASGRPTLPIAQGLRDCALRRVVTRDWDDWKGEIPWMSLYFSTGVWVSLSLVRAPDFDRTVVRDLESSPDHHPP
jgi:hypothetical protein